MHKRETLISASSSATGSATFYLHGATNFSIRLASTAATFDYTVRATLTENESLASGHLIAGPVDDAAAGSHLLEFADKQYYAVAVAYSDMSSGTMTVLLNTGGVE